MAKIIFESVSIKNFMSFGNAEVTFDYKTGINIVTGKVESSGSRNGCGKSVMIVDSLSFGIYGKVLRGGKVILGELVNKINKKDCAVTVIFRIDGERIKVVRTIKPNDLKIYVGEDEELKKFDANGRNQEWLEKKIGINHTCFNNIIVLNVNSSVPFLDMEAAKKREVIENVLSSAIYGRMSDLAKNRHLDLKTDVKACEVAFQSTLKHLEASKNTLARHQDVINRQKAEKEGKIKLIQDEITKVLERIKNTEEQIKKLDTYTTQEKLETEKGIKEKETLITNLRTDIRIAQTEEGRLKEALSHIESVPHCPTCHTPSDNPYIQKYIGELKSDIQKQQEIMTDRKQKGSVAVKEKTAFEQKLGLINEYFRHLESFTKSIEMDKLKVSHKKTELDNEINRKIEQGGVSEDDVKALEVKAKQDEEKLNSASNALRHYTTVRQILGEEGLRKFVVSRILPILNSKVNEYLKIMGSEYTLAFNMNLEEKILSRNREERPYNSFSSGEKKRLDLSVLLALMDISRMQNSIETNILVLDEVLDTSMDSEGVENFLEFLKVGFKKSYPDKCIYIITHRKEIAGESFDRLINLVKRNNFTEIDSIVEMTNSLSVE
jgi:DNA repair exonuclease SbcCD ATPase subunit